MDAQIAKGPGVIYSGRVNEKHRSEGKQFHGLFYGIRGGAGEFGDNGDLLARDGVEQARFAHVAPAKEADVQTE
ncbi:MAG: hypothetical protein AMXMBFR84_20460 [Candidatus Hydrogenedentota bacterium]